MSTKSEAHGGFFLLSRNEGFGTATPRDDLLHPQANKGTTGDSLTETQYFGFSIPEDGVVGYFYLVHHPNLRMTSGGVWAWRGFKQEALACELFDQWTYMSDAALSNDLHSFRLENGYSVSIIEPLQRHRVTYADAARKNFIDLNYEAAIPPVMFGNGKHFEQPMKVTGEVTLRGKRYDVSCIHFRDRSWGKLRPETNLHSPPVGWHCAAFAANDIYLNCTAVDHPELNPDWIDLFPEFPPEKTLNAGWLHRDGELHAIVACKKKTVRNPNTLFPESIWMTIVDDQHRSYELQGTTIAASQYSTWYNVRTPVCLVRWECEGMTGYGDTLEPMWNDYVYASLARRGRA